MAQRAISTGSVRRNCQPCRSSVAYDVASAPTSGGIGRPRPLVASAKTAKETTNDAAST
jgi:hypothetical protein